MRKKWSFDNCGNFDRCIKPIRENHLIRFQKGRAARIGFGSPGLTHGLCGHLPSDVNPLRRHPLRPALQIEGHLLQLRQGRLRGSRYDEEFKEVTVMPFHLLTLFHTGLQLFILEELEDINICDTNTEMKTVLTGISVAELTHCLLIFRISSKLSGGETKMTQGRKGVRLIARIDYHLRRRNVKNTNLPKIDAN